MKETFNPGEVVYHKLSGERLLITNAVKNDHGDEKLWHCRWQTEMGRYEGKVFVEHELTHSK